MTIDGFMHPQGAEVAARRRVPLTASQTSATSAGIQRYPEGKHVGAKSSGLTVCITSRPMIWGSLTASAYG